MCDCGDPDSLYNYCPEHTGPFTEQKQIDEYISKIFKKETIDKLKDYFEELFLRFSKYFILTEKCLYFCKEFYEDKFSNDNYDEDLSVSPEEQDIKSLKKNFEIVAQNFINFLILISEKNFGILHLILNSFLKNHFENKDIEEEFKTNHRCIQLSTNDIKLSYEDKSTHICVCPFLRLFLSNIRDDLDFKNYEEFLLSFNHNLLLRLAFAPIFFSIYDMVVVYNRNQDFLIHRTQFYLEDATFLIAKKTKLIEDSFDLLYQYISKHFKSPKIMRILFNNLYEERKLKLIIMTQTIIPMCLSLISTSCPR